MTTEKQSHVLRCFVCFNRMEVYPRQEVTQCSQCGQGWRLTWVTPTIAKIRGKVYEPSSLRRPL